MYIKTVLTGQCNIDVHVLPDIRVTQGREHTLGITWVSGGLFVGNRDKSKTQDMQVKQQI